jgi:hypothetical protein
MLTVNRALIIKYLTEENGQNCATGFMLEPIGEVTALDVATTLCASFLQMSFKAGKSHEESRELLINLLDSMKDLDFNTSENVH